MQNVKEALQSIGVLCLVFVATCAILQLVDTLLIGTPVVGQMPRTALAQPTLDTHSASSAGRIQVVSAQRINLEQQAVSVVTLRDTQTHREYLVVVGGQVIPLDDAPRSGVAK